MIGGAGNDYYFVDNAGDVVVEDEARGTDTVSVLLATYSIADNENVENLTGLRAPGMVLAGNIADNEIRGYFGDDELIGGVGNDTLIGGQDGDDTYVVDSYADEVIEVPGEGTDTIITSLSAYSIFNNKDVENLTGEDPSTAFRLTGNDGNNVLTGGGFADELIAGAGDDTLIGNGGDDTLNGGSGADSMVGGIGDDVYRVDSYRDEVIETSAYASGTDTIETSLLTYSIFSKLHVENLSGTASAGHRLTGNDNDNVLTGAGGGDELIGGAGEDTMVGGAGGDTMDGGSGEDTYIVDSYSDVVVEFASEDEDLILTGLSAYSIFNIAHVENLWGTSDTGQKLTGNDLNNQIEGGAGDDEHFGREGDDTMRGGSGDDDYYVDSYGDVVIEFAGQGDDSIWTSLSAYSIFSNIHVENIIGRSNEGQRLTGNDRDNVLTGAGGNDELIAGTGNDTLFGGAGDDTLNGGSGADVFVFDTEVGSDVDLINGFNEAVDAIHLNGDVFDGIGGAGKLDPRAFHVDSMAADSDHRIIYDPSSGQLFYDPDGDGGEEQLLFAELSTGLSLSVDNFTII